MALCRVMTLQIQQILNTQFITEIIDNLEFMKKKKTHFSSVKGNIRE